jgi:hypothetical protein
MRFTVSLKVIFAVAAAAALSMVNGASASTISWETNTALGSCQAGYTCDSTSRTFIGSDGITSVTATAWSKNNSNVIETAQLGFYSNGLGVTNNANDGSHTVDNQGYTDFVAFYFNQIVDLKSVFLNTYGDTDITAWIGTTSSEPVFTGQDFADLDLAYGAGFNNTGGNVNREADFGGNSEFGNLLIVSAMVNNSDGYYDNFKIKALYAESATTPDNDIPGPATLLVFGPAVFAMGVMRRRARKKHSAEQADAVPTNEQEEAVA